MSKPNCCCPKCKNLSFNIREDTDDTGMWGYVTLKCTLCNAEYEIIQSVSSGLSTNLANEEEGE